MSQFNLDELQASLINHEHRINRSNTSLEDAFATQSLVTVEEAQGDITLEAEK